MFHKYTTEKFPVTPCISEPLRACQRPKSQMSGWAGYMREPIFYNALPVVMRAMAWGLQKHLLLRNYIMRKVWFFCWVFCIFGYSYCGHRTMQDKENNREMTEILQQAAQNANRTQHIQCKNNRIILKCRGTLPQMAAAEGTLTWAQDGQC